MATGAHIGYVAITCLQFLNWKRSKIKSIKTIIVKQLFSVITKGWFVMS